jgi:heme exporter protein A
LCGLLRPENGAVFWQNENIALQPELYHANLCYIGHASGLKDELSALENLRLLHAATAARPLNDMPLVDSLRQIGLENYLHRPVRTLSQGQKRRVALAKLGISQAPLWILDEPLASLDGEAIQVIRDLLVNHLRAKGMLVMTSHQTIDLTIPGRELWIGNRPEDNSLDHAHASNDTMASCV